MTKANIKLEEEIKDKTELVNEKERIIKIQDQELIQYSRMMIEENNEFKEEINKKTDSVLTLQELVTEKDKIIQIMQQDIIQKSIDLRMLFNFIRLLDEEKGKTTMNELRYMIKACQAKSGQSKLLSTF